MTHALAISELVTEEIELLPARETLAWLNVANVTATNLALAQNVASFAAFAGASANQGILVVQT
jgi:hypothetical protein